MVNSPKNSESSSSGNAHCALAPLSSRDLAFAAGVVAVGADARTISPTPLEGRSP